MALIDAATIAIQIVLPLLLIGVVAFIPAKSGLGLLVQVLSVSSALLALLLAAVWMAVPWWIPYGYLALLAGGMIAAVAKNGLPRRWLPQGVREWIKPALLGVMGAWSASIAFDALAGHQPPGDAPIVDLAFPLGEGTYLVASGGASEAVNGHFGTLHPRTDRQRAYRGQSYAVDLIKVDRWGRRAFGWRPADPAAYAIFGEPVFAPCGGRVLRAKDGMPDMSVPRTDTSLLEGNHVILACGNTAVLLAHLRRASVRVAPGQEVRAGTLIGRVGNSGQSTEPHMHIHVQTIPESGPLLSGDPIYFRMDGQFAVRNMLLEGRER